MKTIGRNHPCLCNSGLKYRQCCGRLAVRHPSNDLVATDASALSTPQGAQQKAHTQSPILVQATNLLMGRRYQDALLLIENAGVDAINDAALLNVAASCAFSLDQPEKAEVFWLRALSLQADDARVYFNLGVLLQQRKRYPAAEACYRQALLYQPDYAEAYNNLAFLLQECKRFAEAEANFRLALSLKPDYPKAEWNLSLLLLALQRFEEGWRRHEARYHPSVDQAKKPRLPFPQWQGQALAGKSLLLWPEQGHGDEIQFCRYVAVLKKMGAEKITLVCKKPLQRLFESLQGVDAVVVLREQMTLPAHDFWTPLQSVPLYCGAAIPVTTPYLQASMQRMTYWAARLPQYGMRVGLVWQGASRHKNDANRSIADLAMLGALWQVPGISFISLQKEQAEAQALSSVLPILALGADIEDFADSAAILAQLDLVISVDTAVAHLAGALNKPCWVLLPTCVDWRWSYEKEDNLWYPSLRLFRQTQPGDWAEVIDKVADKLNEFSRDRSGTLNVLYQ